MKKLGWPLFVVLGAAAVMLLVLSIMGGGTSGEGASHGPLADRPLLHARLNATNAVLLTLGFVFIRRRMIRGHLTCMTLAALVSIVFLASYLQYHAHAGSTAFTGQGWIRPVYFGILLSHTILAAVVVPLVATLFWLAIRRRFDRHRGLGRWTLPIWIYVSVTGVLIYAMLYVWFPSG